MKEASPPAISPPAPDAPATATTNDGQDLAELLRSMTTTTTIEKFDEQKTSTAASTSTAFPVDASPLGEAGSYLPHQSSVPISITRSYKVWGIPTHTFCQIFSDRIVLGVTQLRSKSSSKESSQEYKSSGHIGSWVYCQASRSQIDPKQVDFELSTLLGGSNPSGVRDEKEIYARRITERLLEKKSIPGGTDRIVLLLGISLSPITSSSTTIDRFKVLVEALVELVEEALRIALS